MFTALDNEIARVSGEPETLARVRQTRQICKERVEAILNPPTGNRT